MSIISLEKDKIDVKKAQNDKNYFAAIYDRYYTRIFLYIKKKVNDKELSEDLASVTFEKALKNLDYFKWQGISFASWLFRIARNTVFDYFRSAKNRRVVNIIDESTIESKNKEDFEISLIRDETELKLYESISKLSVNDQYLVYYKYFERMSIDEISDKLNISKSNAATRLYRVREKIKKLLNKP
ncbi:RNA polymerase sigma factor [Candidatus Dojkabacteria bacterium]|nr:RNA polymerase sigma factor [Candidatus Dojkabacteria bacterium]